MKNPPAIRQPVFCSQCSNGLMRLTWNYGKRRPIRQFFCDTACKGAWQREQREGLGFTREWLIDQYVTQSKGTNQIGREIGRDGKRVWEWIIDYGIPTRPRGSDPRQHFPKGHSLGRGKKHSPATREKMRAIALATGRVPFDPKVGSYMQGRKGANTPNWKGGITPERQSFYSSPEWSQAVKKVWKRDDAICQRCKLDHRSVVRGNPRFHIHHIDSFAIKERRASLDNLILLCSPCHNWTHSNANTERLFLGKGH